MTEDGAVQPRRRASAMDPGSSLEEAAAPHLDDQLQPLPQADSFDSDRTSSRCALS